VLRRAWPAYLLVPGVLGGYLYLYLHGPGVRRSGGYPGAELARFLWMSWSRSFVPGLLGGPLRWQFTPSGWRTGGSLAVSAPPHTNLYPIANPPGWLVALGVLAVVVVAGAGARRVGWTSLRGWALLLGTFVVAQVTVASARLAHYGPGIGAECRYLADLVPLAALSLGLILFRTGNDAAPPVPPVPPVPPAPPAPRVPPATTRRGWVPVLALGVVSWLGFLASAVPVSNRWADSAGHRYLSTLHDSLRAADRASRPWSLYDTVTPDWLVRETYGPYNKMASLARLAIGHPVSVNDPRAELLVVDATGRARAARFEVAAVVPGRCLTPGQSASGPISPAAPEGWWFVRVRYSSPGGATLHVAIDGGAGTVDGTGRFAAYHVLGAGELVVPLRKLGVAQVSVRGTDGAVCIEDIRLGRPVPG
jgi:hypothetical protein